MAGIPASRSLLGTKYCISNIFLQERWFNETVEYALPPNTKPGSELPSIQASTKEEGEEALVNNGTRPKRFIPFSQGVRDCPGQALAKMNAMAALAGLLSHFTFTLSDEVGLNTCQHDCYFQAHMGRAR